jgi:hypothetical protein
MAVALLATARSDRLTLVAPESLIDLAYRQRLALRCLGRAIPALDHDLFAGIDAGQDHMLALAVQTPQAGLARVQN